MPTNQTRLRSRTSKRRRIGTGIAAAATAAGVLAAPSLAYGYPIPYLHQGSRGATVAKVQRKLHIPASGRFNTATTRAVMRFQRHDSLMIDGIVGPQTWDALFGITPSQSPAPVPASAPAAAGVSASTTGGYSIPSGIVQCESGGNYSAVNPQSGAGGAYQILPSTWAAYGGQGLPQDAPPAEQNRIAGEIYARQGASAWAC